MVLWTTWQQWSFLYEIFFLDVLKEDVLCVLCQSIALLKNYAVLWRITYQENYIGYFVLTHAWNEQIPWQDGFSVSIQGSQQSFLNVRCHPCPVLSIKKCWLAENCHVSLTMVCRMWLKLSANTQNMPSSHICDSSSVKSGPRAHRASLIHRREMVF